MKKTLALLIAVLMVVAILPLSVLTAAAEDSDVNCFAVYNGVEWTEYATLAEADAALADGYTLKVLAGYVTDASYTWGESRSQAINFTIDGDYKNITYTGNETAWLFGASCAGAKVTLKNVALNANNGGVALAASDGAFVEIQSGSFIASGAAVVRTVAGDSANTPATLEIYGGMFGLRPSANVQATDAVVTNGDAGNVIIYGGVFVSASDMENGSVYSEYVLRHTNAAGDFKIFGGDRKSVV